MKNIMWKTALVLVLSAWASAGQDLDGCACVDVSRIRDGVSFHCKHCKSIPQRLPTNLTYLGLDEFTGRQVEEHDFHRYKESINQITLYVESNTPANIGIHSFQNLGVLTRLFLIENRMEHFPHLPHSIEIVEMQSNALTTVPDMYLPKLVEMMLDNNLLSETPALLIAPKLAVLSLFGNQIKSANLRQLPSLRLVDLGKNKLETFPQLPEDVSILRLSRNEIRTIPSLKLRNLRQVDLSHNKITHIMNGTFDNCPGLHMVNLEHNPIKYIHPSQRAWLKHMDEVDLPQGMTLERPISRSWMEIGIYTLFGLCGVVLFLIVILLMSKRVRARRYRELDARNIWHVDIRTPIYKPKLRKNQIIKSQTGRGYTRLAGAEVI